jgi:hypothetical protein
VLFRTWFLGILSRGCQPDLAGPNIASSTTALHRNKKELGGPEADPDERGDRTAEAAGWSPIRSTTGKAAGCR